MWIFRKVRSGSQTINSSDIQFYLLCGRTYIIGRKNADIIIDGDASISRKHATLSVKKISCSDSTQPPDRVSITDISKTGVRVNEQPITTNVELELKVGDYVDIGNPSQRYELLHHKLVVVTSCVNSSAAKTTVKTTVEALGGRVESNWTENSTHLIMEKITFTIKVVGAIACAKSIVTVKYLEDLLDSCDKKKGLSLPDVTKYLPPVTEKSLTGQDLMFSANAKRRSLMEGKLFVVLASPQFERIKDVVQFAGGEVALKETKDAKLVNGAISSQTLVLQVEKRDEKGMNASQTNWMKELYTKLKKHKLRPIRESEIGLGIFNVSLEKHCNPTLSGAPMLMGSTHTQVMQESMCLNTQQQSTQPPSDSAPNVLDVATPDLPPSASLNALNESTRPTLPVSMKEQDVHVDREVVNENGKRRMQSSESHSNSGKQGAENLFATKKVKVSPVRKNFMKEEDNSAMFDEKPASKCRIRGTQPQKNIIDIEDDEDEDDVFSVNFPKPSFSTSTMTTVEEPTMKTADLFDIDDDDDDEVASEKEASALPVTPGLSYPAATVDIGPSAALFTTHSKRSIPETCFTAVTPAARDGALSESRIPDTCYTEIVTSSRVGVDNMDKSRISESCPLKVQENTMEDDDSDDDPFAFSVSKWKNSTTRNTNGNNKKESGRSERDSFLFKTREESGSEEGKLASDSDTSMNRTSTDEEKQQSRFRKGISSSQCSDASQEVLVSDGEGNLVPRDNATKKVTCVKESVSETGKETVNHCDGADDEPKNVDMSYLLDGCDDDMDDVEPSKEYHPQRASQNYATPSGFISTRTAVPPSSTKVMKVEDNPDLIGIDTRNLVTRTVTKLVVKPQLQHKRPDPRTTGLGRGEVNGCRLKNFKNFRKQHYAGSSSVSSIRLQVFESDNEERAALFADICEKDEAEAAENRRIDKMFDGIPSSRKR